MVEYIQQDKFLDKIRIRQGLILDVVKYKNLSGGLCFKDYDRKKDMKRVSKGICQSKVDIYDSWHKIIHPAGTYFLGDRPIEIVESKDYDFEIRVASGSIYGDKTKILREMKQIEEIINSY